MERQTIRGEGEEAVERFIKLVDGAKVSDNARLGDVIVPVDGRESYVELKPGLGGGDEPTIGELRRSRGVMEDCEHVPGLSQRSVRRWRRGRGVGRRCAGRRLCRSFPR